MEPPGYYNASLAEAARQFVVPEKDVRSWLLRGALDGQWWVHLGPRRGEEPIVRLWHGTSKDRCAALLERGFWTVTGGKQFSHLNDHGRRMGVSTGESLKSAVRRIFDAAV